MSAASARPFEYVPPAQFPSARRPGVRKEELVPLNLALDELMRGNDGDAVKLAPPAGRTVKSFQHWAHNYAERRYMRIRTVCREGFLFIQRVGALKRRKAE